MDELTMGLGTPQGVTLIRGRCGLAFPPGFHKTVPAREHTDEPEMVTEREIGRYRRLWLPLVGLAGLFQNSMDSGRHLLEMGARSMHTT